MYCEINTLSSSSAKGKQVLQPFPMFESGNAIDYVFNFLITMSLKHTLRC